MKNEKLKTEAAPFGIILDAYGEKKILLIFFHF